MHFYIVTLLGVIDPIAFFDSLLFDTHCYNLEVDRRFSAEAGKKEVEVGPNRVI